MKLLAAALFLLASATAFAQDRDVVFQKVTVIGFTDEVIDGRLDKPDATAIDARKRFKWASLIKTRASFRTELLASVPR
jgi:hypothetical protein